MMKAEIEDKMKRFDEMEAKMAKIQE